MSNVNSTVVQQPLLPHEHPVVSHRLGSHTLTRRHFVLQDDRPEHLGDIDLLAVDPFLRGLLFTDGTVTRTLEVQTLARVSVEVVAQARSVVSGHIASHLGVPSGTRSVRRRVVIRAGVPATPIIRAESHILPDRLPDEFLSVLHDAPDGIGESLQQVKLESWRDMLWFGLGSSPEWSHAPASPAITRMYRVIAGGRPALLISESFAVERRFGMYHLAGVA